MPTRDQLLYPDDDFASIALENARTAATRLNGDTLAEFARQIMSRLDLTGPQPHLESWLGIIQEGPEAVRNIMLDPSEYGRYMRSLVPFRAFVTPTERREIIQRVRGARERSSERA